MYRDERETLIDGIILVKRAGQLVAAVCVKREPCRVGIGNYRGQIIEFACRENDAKIIGDI